MFQSVNPTDLATLAEVLVLDLPTIQPIVTQSTSWRFFRAWFEILDILINCRPSIRLVIMASDTRGLLVNRKRCFIMNEENSNSKSNGCCQRDSVANPLERNPISRTIKTSQPTHCSTALKKEFLYDCLTGIRLFKRKYGIQIRNSLFLRNFRYSYVANPYS